MHYLKKLQERIHRENRERGFWNPGHAAMEKKLLLLHTKVTELAQEAAAEGFPDRHDVYDRRGKLEPMGFGVKLADLAILLFDLAEAHRIDLFGEMAEKLSYNLTKKFVDGKEQ